LNFSNPHWLSSNPKRNRDAKISDALDEALKNIDTDLGDQPEIQAEILFTIGQTYTGQAEFEKAEKLLRQSIEKFNQVLGNGNLKAEQATVILGDALSNSGKFDDGANCYLEAINYFRPKVVEDKTQLKWLVIALNNLGSVYSVKGKFAEYESTVKESLGFARGLTGKDRYVFPIVLGNLGLANFQKGNYSDALEYYSQAFENLRSIGNEQRLEAGAVLTSIARTYNAMGDLQKAEEYYQKAYEILIKNVNESNLYSMNNRMFLAYNYYQQEKYKDAESIVKKVIEINQKAYPNGHITIAFQRQLLGEIYTKLGKLKEGEGEAREPLELILKTYKEPNHEISSAKMSLAINLIAQKRFAEAKELLTSALDGYLKTKGENHKSTKECRELLNKIPA
jgi:eukaryotic-like serine/threonine-protein kinase